MPNKLPNNFVGLLAIESQERLESCHRCIKNCLRFPSAQLDCTTKELVRNHWVPMPEMSQGMSKADIGETSVDLLLVALAAVRTRTAILLDGAIQNFVTGADVHDTLGDPAGVDAVKRGFPVQAVGREMTGCAYPEIVVGTLAETAVETADRVEDAAMDYGGDDVDVAVEQELRVNPAGQSRCDAVLCRPPDRRGRREMAAGVGMPELESAVDDAGFGVVGEVLQLGGELAGQPDVVGIEEGQQIGSRIGDGEVARGGRAAMVVAQYADACIEGGGDLRGAIRRAVINHDDFEVVDTLGKDAGERFFDVGRAVVGRHDDGEKRACSWHGDEDSVGAGSGESY